MQKASTAQKNKRDNLITYAGFILFAIAGIFYGNAIAGDFTSLRVWEFQNILILLCGVPFLFLQDNARLPDFWDARISTRQRWLVPATTGAVFGILDVAVIKIMMHPQPYSEWPPFLQPFPYSVFLFVSGAFEIEVFYRFIPLSLILLLGRWYANGKYLNGFFWAGAVLTSLREPLEQLPDGGAVFVTYSLVTGFLMNSLQAFYFRRSGFLASLATRLGHYLFWHMLLGIYVQYVELS